MKTKHTVLAMIALGLVSCIGTVPVDNEEHDTDDPSAVDLGTQPWRARRRMDVHQLDASLHAVTDGIGWEQMASDGTVQTNYFERYEDTLGVPDYLNATSEDLSVTLLFQKFLDDAARSACGRLVAREAGLGPAYEGAARGTFDPIDLNAEEDATDADIREALSRLLLRFHGRRVAPDATTLTPWRELVAQLDEAARTAELTEPVHRTWEGVCVALLTHPDFYSY